MCKPRADPGMRPSPGGARAQLAHPLLLRSAPGRASIVMMGSVAGGPTSLKSGSVYAMTKGAPAPAVRRRARGQAAFALPASPSTSTTRPDPTVPDCGTQRRWTS